MAATELEQQNSLKVSSQSPYLLPSEGHGEVQEEEEKKEAAHLRLLRPVCLPISMCVCVHIWLRYMLYVCVHMGLCCVQTCPQMQMWMQAEACVHVCSVHSPGEHV